MKYALVIILLFMSVQVNGQDKNQSVNQSLKIKSAVYEVACGQCQFNQPGFGCDLAIKIKGKVYWIDGTSIDDHGDAHADDGFCNKIRKARVSGELKNNRVKISDFILIKATLRKQG